jgi:ketosteroid isomerase-like protein
VGLRGGAGDSDSTLIDIEKEASLRKEKWLMRIVAYRILVLALVAGSAHAAPPQDAEQRRIISLENAWNQAVQQKDARAVAPLLGEELVTIDYDGTLMGKAQYLAGMKTPSVHFEHIASDSMQVQFFGDSAVVIGAYVEKGVKGGKPFSHRERFIDTWINRNGTWVCVASQSTLIVH